MVVFHEALLKHIDEVMPEKSCRVSNNRGIKEAWMTKGLLKCSKKQLQLYQKFLSDRSDANRLKYQNYRKTFQQIKRKCRKQFYLEKCIEFKSDSKKLWRMINTVTGKCMDKRCVISKNKTWAKLNKVTVN